MTGPAFAVLLCRYEDAEDEYDVDWFRRLFSAEGADTGNVVDYFHEASNGHADLSGSEVFENILLPRQHSDYVGSGANPQGRDDLVNWATSAALKADIPLSEFSGGVVIMTLPPSDVFGNYGHAVLNPNTSGLGEAAHEMSHALGLQHSWNEMPSDDPDYGDPYDMMSWARTRNPIHPEYGIAGPLLNAVNMRRLGWLDEDRITKITPGTHEVALSPLARPDLKGPLAAQVDQYVIEYRPAIGWDRAFDAAGGVLVHSRAGDRSVLHYGTLGQSLIVEGGSFGSGLPWLPYERRISVEVQSLAMDRALLRVTLKPAKPSPQAGPGITVGGVDAGGGGWVIVGGQIVWVSPREPIISMLEQISLITASDSLADKGLAAKVRAYALEQIGRAAERASKEL